MNAYQIAKLVFNYPFTMDTTGSFASVIGYDAEGIDLFNAYSEIVDCTLSAYYLTGEEQCLLILFADLLSKD